MSGYRRRLQPINTKILREDEFPFFRTNLTPFLLRNREMSSVSSASFSRSIPATSFTSPPPSKRKTPNLPLTRKPIAPVAAFKIGAEELAELAHNKVLVASTLSCAIGQLAKPFTSALNRNCVDLKASVRAGGMPSTHSAGVAAAATSLGLERGFSDPVFGMSVVFAALVMYDAQGVRREVGNHAKILNKMMEAGDSESKSTTSTLNSEEVASVLSTSEKANSYMGMSETYSLHKSGISSSKLKGNRSLEADAKEPFEKFIKSYSPFYESVGHTEIQVLVGALLGFIISLAIDTMM